MYYIIFIYLEISLVVSSRLFCSEAKSNNGPSPGIDRKLILDSSLGFVPQYGWSVKALECGAKAVDFPGVAHGLFPSGGVELIEHFEFDCNARLIKYLEDMTTRDNEPYVINLIILVFSLYFISTCTGTYVLSLLPLLYMYMYK